MGTSTSTKQFARKVAELTKVPLRVSTVAVKVNVKNGAGNAERAVRAATGGSARLRNAGAVVRAPGSSRVVGVKGAKLTVSSKVQGNGQAGTLRAVGPWQLIEYPTQKHDIGPAGLGKDVLSGPTLSGRALKSKSGRAGAKTRQGRATALRTPYGLKRRVHVKGTRGKYPWRKAREKTTREAPAALHKAAFAELTKVFR